MFAVATLDGVGELADELNQQDGPAGSLFVVIFVVVSAIFR